MSLPDLEQAIGPYLVGNNPKESVVASFGSAQTDTWQNAQTGGAWVYDAGAQADYDVAGGFGTITHPAVNVAHRTHLPVLLVNGDLLFRVKTDKLAVGAEQQAWAIFRWIDVNNYYYARLTFRTTQAVQLGIRRVVAGVETTMQADLTAVGLTHAAGTFFWVRVRVTGTLVGGTAGTEISVRAWKDGDPEPVEDFQVRATDATAALQKAGAVGLGSILFTGATNAPVVFSYDDFAWVAGPQGPYFRATMDQGTDDAPAQIRIDWTDPAISGGFKTSLVTGFPESPCGKRVIIGCRRANFAAGDKLVDPWLFGSDLTNDIDMTTVTQNTAPDNRWTQDKYRLLGTSVLGWARRLYGTKTGMRRARYRVFGRMAESVVTGIHQVRLHSRVGSSLGKPLGIGPVVQLGNQESATTDVQLVDLGMIDVDSAGDVYVELYVRHGAERVYGVIGTNLYIDPLLIFVPMDWYMEVEPHPYRVDDWAGEEAETIVGGATVGAGVAVLKGDGDEARYPSTTGTPIPAGEQHIVDFDADVRGDVGDLELKANGLGTAGAATETRLHSFFSAGRRISRLRFISDGSAFYFAAKCVAIGGGLKAVINRVRHRVLRYANHMDYWLIDARALTAKHYKANGTVLQNLKVDGDWPVAFQGDMEFVVLSEAAATANPHPDGGVSHRDAQLLVNVHVFPRDG